MAAKYTPAQITEKFLIVNQRIANDEPLREVLKDMQISSNTWGDWCRLSAEHELQYVRATQVRADNIFEEILDIADEANKDVLRVDEYGNQIINNEFVQRSRIRIEARKWILGKMNQRNTAIQFKLKQARERLK
jgi:hypothetical protein